MRIVLDAPAVRLLLERHPEATLEMAKTAAAQIAQEMARRMTREALERSVSDFIASNLAPYGGWYQRHIAPKYQAMMVEAIQAEGARFAQDAADGAVGAKINERLNAMWAEAATRMEAEMRAMADRLVRERFSALFAAAPAEGGKDGKILRADGHG